MRNKLFILILALFCTNCKKTELLKITADFEPNKRYISVNDTVKFINSSLNATSYLWHFPGASPEYSTEKNPIVVYKQYGIFAVSLKLFNESESDSNTKDSLIIVDYSRIGIVNEGIIYRNLMGDSIIHTTFNIDLNTDGINDIKLVASNGTVCGGASSTSYASIESLNSNVYILNDSISPKILSYGDTLEHQNGWNSGTFTLYNVGSIPCSNPRIDWREGTWFGIVHHYVGIKIKDRFGWIQMGTDGSGGWEIHDWYGPRIRIYDYGLKK